MNAVEFYDIFRTRITEDAFFEVYHKNSDFTSVITNELNKIVDDAGLIHENEYFRYDVIGYKSAYEKMLEQAQQEGIGLKAHFWDLEIAIEHENNKKDWTDEVMKLVHVKCPLKVVIGYSPWDQRDNEEEKKLSFVAQWMKRERAFSIGKGQEEYLVILGNAKAVSRNMPEYTKFDYRAYLYDWDKEQFQRIGEE